MKQPREVPATFDQQNAFENAVDSAAEEALPPSFSEDAIALCFGDLYWNSLRYVSAWKTWLGWDGTHWRKDNTLFIFDMVRKVCREAAAECPKEKAAMHIASASAVAAVERLARADRRFAATAEQWDSDNWLLNTPGGVIDLRTGSVHERRQEEYLTKVTTVGPEGECPRWITFLAQIFDGDQGLIDFIQRFFGYCLTGITREECFVFLFGTGSNGKTVLINTLRAILGSYHKTAPMETFTAACGERHPTDLAGLSGARVVTAIETEEGKRWSEAKIKAMTGGDEISARFMRRDFFEYTPRYKPIIAGNYKPVLRSVTESMRRRLLMVPCTVTIPESHRDRGLTEKLQAERPGILRWMIAGCLEWQRIGLAVPAAVQHATADYFDKQDLLGEWLEEACECDAQAWIPSIDLYTCWAAWTERRGEQTGSQKQLSEHLEARGYKPHRRHLRGFSGLRLKGPMGANTEGPRYAIDATDASFRNQRYARARTYET